jgi:hypothetical protein
MEPQASMVLTLCFPLLLLLVVVAVEETDLIAEMVMLAALVVAQVKI